MEQGEIVAIQFNNDDYLDFIHHCFVNVLISGVDVKFKENFGVTLIVRVAAPGIDRLDRSILKFKGRTLTF